MAGEVDAERLAAKLWRSRNSDGKWSWGDEHTVLEETHAPPSFTEEDHPLPDGAVVLTNPEDSEEARAVRHVHVFDSSIVEPT